MKTIALIIMVSTLIEGLIEYAKTIIKLFEEGDYKTAKLQIASIVLGVALALVWKLQLFSIGLSDVYEASINPTIDMILTGIVASRGANYANDFIGKLRHKDNSAGQLLAMHEDGLDYVDDVVDEEYDEVGEEDADSEEA